MQVLCVDDESIMQTVYKGTLDTMGHQAIPAWNGQEAIDIYQARWQEIDLVILDLIMPQLTGHDTFYALKKVNPSVKVILCSGYEDNCPYERLIEDGALCLIKKPFKLDELCSWIDKTLG